MGKIITFIYGTVAYLVFLMSFLYAVGFVAQMVVPKHINTGTENALWPSIAINLMLLTVFALQHSIMARPVFKAWVTRFIHPATERSTYVLLTSLALLLLFWKWQPMTSVIWNIENEMGSMLLLGLHFAGWLIVLLSTFMINHFELLGLLQIYNNLKDRKTGNPKFQTNYLYKLVRHPLMLGFVIAFWATPLMTVGHLLFAIVTTVYIFVAVKFLEEKDLRKAIGKEYETYQKEVPMIIPFT